MGNDQVLRKRRSLREHKDVLLSIETAYLKYRKEEMMKLSVFYTMPLVAFFSAALMMSGCGAQSGDKGDNSGDNAEAAHDDGHDHSGWWCKEHGVPEAECSMCSAKAAADFKAKGDWCEEHNRAESQCFLCDPSRAEKYAKLYKAKFGHAPPQPEE